MLVFTRLHKYNIHRSNSLYVINKCNYGYYSLPKQSRHESRRIHYSGNYFSYQYTIYKKIFRGKTIMSSTMIFRTFGPNPISYQFEFIGETFKLSKYRIFIITDSDLYAYVKRFFNRGSIAYFVEKKHTTQIENSCKKVIIRYQYLNNKIQSIIITHTFQNKPLTQFIKKLAIAIKYHGQTIDNIVIENDKREKIKYIQ